MAAKSILCGGIAVGTVGFCSVPSTISAKLHDRGTLIAIAAKSILSGTFGPFSIFDANIKG
jgi:hypothetical protein